ncbi:MAG: hypothetical protein NW226_17650 [Microscillaceae bacterium]|nr:hypothetical protein [Microscillaceae bacterium]
MKKQRILSSSSLLKKEFKMLKFEGFWADMLGEPESNFKALVWGPAASGKSTLTLRLCDYLTKWGKVGYNTWEEGHAKTFKDRLNSNNIDNPKLFVIEKYSFEEMMSDDFKRKGYKTIVIDSLQYAHFSYDQYKKLVARYPSKIIILISQVNGRGRIKGGTDFLHAVDMKIYCNNGMAQVQSRFTDEKTVQIFEKKIKAGEQAKLFVGNATCMPKPALNGVTVKSN